MKTLVTLFACLSLVACVANTDTHESNGSSNPPSDNSINLPSDGPGSAGYGCNVASYVHVTVDGHGYWVQVPTLCDPSPYIFKGDPGPDLGDPYDDKVGPVTNEEIMEKLYAKLAASSGTHSAPVQ